MINKNIDNKTKKNKQNKLDREILNQSKKINNRANKRLKKTKDNIEKNKNELINNIEEYLLWRGDISFDKDPFNEVDNVILSELSYVDFGDIVKKASFSKPISIKLIKEKYFKKHTTNEILARDNFVKMAPFLMNKIVLSKRYEHLKVAGYKEIIDEKKVCQFVSVIFEVGDGTYYLSYGGTDTTIVGWKEDCNLSWMLETAGQKEALNYLNKSFNNKKCKLRVGGHSKGGNFAIYASAFSKADVKKQIIQIYSNDSPGFLKEIVNTKEYKSIVNKIISIIPEGSIIGILLDNSFHSKKIKSFNKGIMQHDLLSWEVKGKAFVEAEKLNGNSLSLAQTIKNWVASLDIDTKKSVVEAIFNIFESTGAKTFTEMWDNGFESVLKMIDTAGHLSKDKRKNILLTLKGLMNESKKTFLKSFKLK